jgi:hypothetical protein
VRPVALLRRLDDRVLGDWSPGPGPVDAATERAFLGLAVFGLLGLTLALTLVDRPSLGYVIGSLCFGALAAPYVDLRVRRWLRR